MTDFKAIRKKLNDIRTYHDWWKEKLPDADLTVAEIHCAELLSIVGPLIELACHAEHKTYRDELSFDKDVYVVAVDNALAALEKFNE